ncbi:hypothetical protein ACFRMQ_01170 [Kitasatospora sp. NPDC056783]
MHCLECRSADTTSTAAGVRRGCGAGVRAARQAVAEIGDLLR